MKRVLFALLLGMFVIPACGGDAAPAEEESTGGEDIPAHDRRHVDDEHEYAEHPEMAPALEEFHYAFSLHWHGDRSATAVCADIERLQGLASAASAEHEDEAISEELSISTQSVVDTCANDTAAYPTAFDRMHHALHAMMGVPLD
ncbi:MAG: hypothetical protein ACI9KE_003722 [Polyangiales bacterium]|jgi:hypothetical protein